MLLALLSYVVTIEIDVRVPLVYERINILSKLSTSQLFFGLGLNEISKLE